MFLAFSITAAALYSISINQWWRKAVMLAANVAFIASFTTSPKMLLPYACFLALGYLSVLIARFTTAKRLDLVTILGFVAAFCWLKKYWFFSLVPSLPFAYLSVGLSYCFFRILGMIIDSRTEAVIANTGPIDFLNFAINFPTMVAGPIDRFQNFVMPTERVKIAQVGAALERITLGFFKVLVPALIVSRWQTGATAALLDQAGKPVWSAVASFGLYPIFLYLNFSGYTDIVLGIGRLFGAQYPENFNAPFSSCTFIDFWSRWHMSLSFWLRDYVYSPFLKWLMERNLPLSFDPYLGIISYFLTFFLIGIWHGSTAIFAIFGLLLALGVSVCKLYQIAAGKVLGKKRYKDVFNMDVVSVSG